MTWRAKSGTGYGGNAGFFQQPGGKFDVILDVISAVQKSLESLSRPVVLIAGGKDKGSDFLPLKQTLKQKVKHLILMGETRSKFRQILNGSFSYEEVNNMEEAVRQAVDKAAAGDVILLSPACASFDMFIDYADRGNQFKTIVQQL